MIIERSDLSIALEATSGDTGFPHDNWQHRFVEPSKYILPALVGVTVTTSSGRKYSALLGGHGGGTGTQKTNHIVEDNRLIICCSDKVFCLELPTLKFIWSTQADEATCFQIFRYKESYVIHGEMNITKLRLDGSIEWQKSGRDIFVNLDGKTEFKIEGNTAIAVDFEGYEYRFDLD